MRNAYVVPRDTEKSIGIDAMRAALPTDTWFDRVECAEGIKCLDGYQFEWNEKLGQWSRTPLPNWASHGADAWMQYAQDFQAGADVAAAIVGETYTVLPSGRVTVCELTLKNGFTVRGESAVVFIENFDVEIGRDVARKKAVDQVWQLLGYELRSKHANA